MSIKRLTALVTALLMALVLSVGALADGQVDVPTIEESETTHDLIAMSHDKEEPLRPLSAHSRARAIEKLGETAGIGGIVTVGIVNGEGATELRRDYYNLDTKAKVGVEMMAFLHIAGEEVTEIQLEAGVPLDKEKAIRVRYTAEALEALNAAGSGSLIFVCKGLTTVADDAGPQLITIIHEGSSPSQRSVRQYYTKGGGAMDTSMDVPPVEPDSQETLDVVEAMTSAASPLEALKETSAKAITDAFGEDYEINEVFTVYVANFKENQKEPVVRDYKQLATPYTTESEVMAILRIVTKPKKGDPRVNEYVIGASIPTDPSEQNEGTVRLVFEPDVLAKLDKAGSATVILVNRAVAEEEAEAETAEGEKQ